MSLDVDLYRLPCAECGADRVSVYSANITHNLGKMASAAGLYEVLWRPDENGMRFAGDLIAKMRVGLALLKSEPVRFRAFDAENGWGRYDDFVPWIERYLAACEAHPTSIVEVWR